MTFTVWQLNNLGVQCLLSRSLRQAEQYFEKALEMAHLELFGEASSNEMQVMMEKDFEDCEDSDSSESSLDQSRQQEQQRRNHNLVMGQVSQQLLQLQQGDDSLTKNTATSFGTTVSSIACDDAVVTMDDSGSSSTSSSSSQRSQNNATSSKTLYLYQREGYDEGMNTYAGPVMLDPAKLPSIECATATVLFNLGQLCLEGLVYEEAEGGNLMLLQAANDCFVQALHIVYEQQQQQQKMHWCGLSAFTSNHHAAARSANDKRGGGSIGGVSVVAILHNLGTIRYKQGVLDQAIDIYARALELGRNSCSQDSTSMLEVAASLNCLGVLYYHLPEDEEGKSGGQGSYKRVLELLQDALSIRRTVLGQDSQTKEIATIINNIGRVYYTRGEYDQALKLYSEALGMRRRTLGMDHLDVAATINNAGQAYHRLGLVDQAVESYEKFVGMASRFLSIEHRDIAMALKGMAQISHERKDYRKADKLYREALSIARAALGMIHPEVAVILNKYANMLCDLGDFNYAMTIFQEGLEVERTIFYRHKDDTFDPSNLVITLLNLGRIYKLRGEYALALPLYQEALTIQRQFLDTMQQQGQQQQQQQQQQRDHHNRADEHNHSIYSTLSSIAMIHCRFGNYDKALVAHQESLQVREMKEEDLDVATTYNSMGLICFKLGDYQTALQNHFESLRIRRFILGNDHRDVALSLYNIATVHLEIGDDEAALACFRATLRVERKALGPYHKDVVVTLQHIGQVHVQRGEFFEALRTFKDTMDILEKQKERREKRKETREETKASEDSDDDEEFSDFCSIDSESDEDQIDHAAMGQTWYHIGTVHMQTGNVKDMVDAFASSVRHSKLATSKEDDEVVFSAATLTWGSCEFYGLSRIYPPCAPVA